MIKHRNMLASALSPRASYILLEKYYKFIPRQIRTVIQGGRRDEIFQSAMAMFLNDPAAYAYPGNKVLGGLIYGWGNEAWGAGSEFLAGCITYAMSSPGAILECGSGLSTILIGAIAKKQGVPHWVLEHNPKWAGRVQHYLAQYQLDSVLYTRPLADKGDYSWYDAPLDIMPDGFSLVVCDGPPSRTKGGRYGMFPTMKNRLMPGCHILLDDAERKGELEAAKRWCNEIGCSFNILGNYKPYITMTMP